MGADKTPDVGVDASPNLLFLFAPSSAKLPPDASTSFVGIDLRLFIVAERVLITALPLLTAAAGSMAMAELARIGKCGVVLDFFTPTSEPASELFGDGVDR